MSARKLYLGDGVYVQFNGYHVELTTENGLETTNRILLEPEVLQALDQFVKSLPDRQELGISQDLQRGITPKDGES